MSSRIRYAAATACGSNPDDALDGGEQYRQCLNGAADRTVAALDHPLVTALNGGPFVTGQAIRTAARR